MKNKTNATFYPAKIAALFLAVLIVGFTVSCQQQAELDKQTEASNNALLLSMLQDDGNKDSTPEVSTFEIRYENTTTEKVVIARLHDSYLCGESSQVDGSVATSIEPSSTTEYMVVEVGEYYPAAQGESSFSLCDSDFLFSKDKKYNATITELSILISEVE